MSQQIDKTYRNLSLECRGNVFILTLQKPPENRLNSWFCQEIICAINDARRALGQDSEGALILRGNDTKFFCTACLVLSNMASSVILTVMAGPGFI